MSTTELGKVIRKLRVDCDVTQRSVAFSIGVTPSYLSAIEYGKREPSKELIGRIEKFFEGQGLQIGTTIHNAAKKSRAKITIDLRGRSQNFKSSLFKLLSREDEKK